MSVIIARVQYQLSNRQSHINRRPALATTTTTTTSTTTTTTTVARSDWSVCLSVSLSVCLFHDRLLQKHVVWKIDWSRRRENTGFFELSESRIVFLGSSSIVGIFSSAMYKLCTYLCECAKDRTEWKERKKYALLTRVAFFKSNLESGTNCTYLVSSCLARAYV